jgi:hypothetical protein
MAIGSAVMVIGFWEMRSKSSKGASYSSAAMELPEEKREEFQKWLSEDAARSYLPKSVQLSSFLNSTGQV